MIIGIGIDLIEKKRINKIVVNDLFDKFAKRILTQKELINVSENIEKNTSFLAKRWAIKEAISKAFGCGIGEKLSFLDIEISNGKFGEPIAIILKNTLNTPNFCGNVDKLLIKISISDTTENAVAMCILEN